MRNASRPGRHMLVGLSLVAACLMIGRFAHAYCRTSVCPNNTSGSRCVPEQPSDCGTPIFWPKPCVAFSLQQDASAQVTLDVAQEVFTTAFDTWMNADCGQATHPRIQVVDLGPVACNEHEYNQKSGNANVIIFRDDAWPHQGSANTLALTTVTFNRNTAEIYDADMELNAAQIELTTGDTNVKFDLRSIAVHEAGHFLGLAHSADFNATMYTDYNPGSTDLRTLSADDVEGICAVYPPGTPIPDSCDATPRHGFASICSPPVQAEESGGCCAVAPGAAGGSVPAGLAFGAASVLLIARRRRSFRHGSAAAARNASER